MKAAVIGLGRMGAFTSENVKKNAPSIWFPLSHAEAINDHPDLKLSALCDINPVNVKKASEKYSVKKVYRNAEKLIREIKPILIGIATRTTGRADLIELCAVNEVKAIHTEKPLCNSIGELKKLTYLFGRDDFYVTWGAIRRFFGIYQKALSLAESGKYGIMREVRVNFGRAPLYWSHPHSIDLILFAASGRIVKQVQAKLTDVSNHTSSTIIENDPCIINASIYFEDGLVGLITQSIGSDFILSCESAEICVRGDGRYIEVYEKSDGPYCYLNRIDYEDPTKQFGTLAPINHLVQCLKSVDEAINENKLLKKDILLAQSILFAMVQSHIENGKPVFLNEIDDSLSIIGVSDGNPA